LIGLAGDGLRNEMMTLDELAAMLDRGAAEAPMKIAEDLKVFGEVVAKESRAMLGHEHGNIWPALAASTLADKERKGFPVPSPLLRTGSMQHSIEAKIESSVVSHTLFVGSSERVAAFQEMGTSRIPPRPFLATSMLQNLPVAAEMFGKLAVSLLTGKPK
jgi:hypothetical protein